MDEKEWKNKIKFGDRCRRGGGGAGGGGGIGRGGGGRGRGRGRGGGGKRGEEDEIYTQQNFSTSICFHNYVLSSLLC